MRAEYFSSDAESIEPDQRVQNPEVWELQEPLEDVIEQLRPRIEGGEYGLIIGDDASGRVPTLIVDRVVKQLYQDRERRPAKTVFMTGSGSGGYEINETVREEKQYRTQELLGRYQREYSDGLKPRRVLIVTDTVRTGNSLKLLTDSLHQAGLEFDIASVGLVNYSEENREEWKTILEEKLGGTIYFSMSGTPTIYHQSQLSGVTKEPGQLHADPYVRSEKAGNQSRKPQFVLPRENPILAEVMDQRKINEVRADARIIAENILRRLRDNSASAVS